MDDARERNRRRRRRGRRGCSWGRGRRDSRRRRSRRRRRIRLCGARREDENKKEQCAHPHQRLTLAVIGHPTWPSRNSYDPFVSGVAFFYDRWGQYNGRLVDAIRSLSDDQLKLRATPTYWPIWAIAAHTAGARVYWLCGVFKEPGAETTPFTDPLSGYGWEDDESTPRSSTELVTALESSWAIVDRC